MKVWYIIGEDRQILGFGFGKRRMFRKKNSCFGRWNYKKLGNLGWYLDKKIGDVDNGNPNPSSWVKFVFVVVCKLCDSLTPLSMPQWNASCWQIVVLGFFVNCRIFFA